MSESHLASRFWEAPSKGNEMTHLITTRAAAASRRRDSRGMTTAEYAVGTVSACSFAGILFQLLTSDFGEHLLQTLINKVMDILPF